MPLWLELLKTPMAAPETKLLKRMRLAILVICALLTGSLTCLAPLLGVMGTGVGGLVAALLVILFFLAPTYIALKNRADNRWLDEQTGRTKL